MSITTSVETPGDAELISAVRGGDVDAYGDLFERHIEAARRLARQLVSPADVDDLVSEAFVKVLGILQRGGGPDVAFRAYLLTALRTLRVDRFRAGARLHTTDDMEAFDPGVPFRDTAVEGFENSAAARAFASLPERWQLVLWHTEVEGDRPADIAPLLGMSPNSVSALAYRAREGLRQAFLTEHAAELEDDTCRWTHQHLGAYIRNGTSRRDGAKVEEHLGECRTCMALYLELSEVNANLGALLAPLLLGGLATTYVGAAAGVTLPAGLGLVIGRTRDLVAGNSAVVAVVGVAATVAVVGGALVLGLDGADRAPVQPAAVASVSPGSTIDRSTTPTTPDIVPLAPGDTVVVAIAATEGPAEPVEIRPASSPTADPTVEPGPTVDPVPTTDASPTSQPTPQPTLDPTVQPTLGPTVEPTLEPTDEPTVEPTVEPTTPPTLEPTDEPSDVPTDVPTPPPPTSPGTDASVSGQFVHGRPTYLLRFEVSGLPASTPGTLTVSTTGAVVLKARDPRCSVLDSVATCAVSGDTSVDIEAVGPRGGTVTAEIRIAGPDPDLDDNTWWGLLD